VTQSSSTPSVESAGCAGVLDPSVPPRCGAAIAPSPDPVGVTVDGMAGAGRVAVTGEIDILTAPRLEAVLAAAVDAYDHLLVDLSGVTFMDAQGINVLLAAHRNARGTLRVVDASPQSARVLRITGVDHVLGIGGP
jgi:anti-sigma B factor antagonist